MEPVLLVEDKAELRAMLRKFLERDGYTVEEAPDGNTAIDKIRSRRYLLILSDLKLPGNSGLDVLLERAARQQELLRENLLLREEYALRYGFPRIVGEHPSMKDASQMTQRVAATDSTVLLLGESGTGKELFARAVHHLSPRADHPFVALNCAAIPEG